jgi:hypothetical protein
MLLLGLQARAELCPEAHRSQRIAERWRLSKTCEIVRAAFSMEERSMFVGFALANGGSALAQLGAAAALHDHDHFYRNATGTPSYPPFLHWYYLQNHQHSGEALTAYYGHESDAVFEAQRTRLADLGSITLQ